MKADDIRRLRQSLGLSQETLARRLGVSFSTVNRWENGKAVPSPMARKGLEDLLSLKQTSGHAVPFIYGAVEKRSCGRLSFSSSFYISRRRLEGASVPDCNMRGDAEALALDLGLGGMRFYTFLDVKAGDELNLSFLFDDKTVLRARSEVVWMVGKGEVRQVGVRFEGVRPVDIFGVVAAVYKQ